MLEVESINVAYGAVQVLWDVSFTVGKGEIVALLGSNGAGKTTALRTIQGLIRPLSGKVQFQGRDARRLGSHDLVATGLSMVPEARLLFPYMTVLENVELGAYPRNVRNGRQERLRRVYDLFPRLRDRARQKVHTLSGGEQQMVAIGRALMARPALLMLDEPSLGLAPLVVAELFRVIRLINEEGISILLVEQNVVKSLQIAHRAYVLENGRIVRTGPATELLGDPQIRASYLGM
ncbi:MAG: ABC transporter ATP-binding protein [Desulfomonile sp.]|nr:ABC transporter ATP-binding protein [Desulfomonile sp.]